MASDQFISDLNTIPNIVGGLGIAIADAQKAFDLEYLSSIERLMYIAKTIFPEGVSSPPDKTTSPPGTSTTIDAFFMNLLKACAPPRYMYTETTLDVRLDLQQNTAIAVGLGLGIGIGAITINGSVSIAYGNNYDAAAEVKTVINAIPSDPTTISTFLDNIKSFMDASPPQPPAMNSVEQQLVDKMTSIATSAGKTTAAPVTSPPSGKGT